MSLQIDPVLGPSYIDPEYFADNARVFGCAAAIADLDPDLDLLPALAAASRDIDAYVGRAFFGDPITENHVFDLRTRRITVNQPPVISLTAFRLRTGAGLVSSFVVTPVQTDGEHNVSFGAVYYNRQENYLELTSLALAGSLTNSLVSLGIGEPQIEITYTTFGDVPKEVVAATGFTAAAILNDNAANALIAPGLGSVRADDVEVRRGAVVSHRGGTTLPPRAMSLLRGLTRIAIG